MDSFSSDSLIVASQADITPEQYWTAVNIWHNNPHFVNRRLRGSKILFSGVVSHSQGVDYYELIHRVCTVHKSTSLDDNIVEKLNCNGINIQECLNEPQNSPGGVLLIIKKLIPRNGGKYQSCLELAVLDQGRDFALFAPLDSRASHVSGLLAVSTPYPYSLQLVGQQMQLCLEKDASLDNNITSHWLGSSLFPKLVKWAQLSDPVCSSKVVRSLSLVSMEAYNALYEKLKDKYGKEMVRIWPERTDPTKFVYEDVAIATYLLLLWEQEREDKKMPEWKQSFIDMGCGNGLLVYILSSEGHRGIGLDVRKRVIWDLYPKTTRLEVCAINPSDGLAFSNYDWLIGNHSDELTPWIPVLAHRSSYTCSFFLLPCCFYDFTGNKYQRRDTSLSQYEDYLAFVTQVCQTCGFQTQIDKLRIPSTKRTCLVGNARTYPITASLEAADRVNSMIRERCEGRNNFTPRVGEERVRNCTQLKEGVTEKVIAIIVRELLSNTEAASKDRKWNVGRTVSLKDLAEAIPKDLLLELKSECGGLQTLLRNKRYIFVVRQGCVTLREPQSAVGPENKPTGVKRRKTGRNSNETCSVKKRCWFFDNHPDRCPLSAEQCLQEH